MLPIVLLSVFGIVVLFLGFSKSKNILLPATLLFLLVTLIANFVDWNHQYLYFNDMLWGNNASMVFSGIVLLSAFFVVALTRGFEQEGEAAQPAEYYGIMLFSLVGAIMMISYENLIILFVGVEILSVSIYILTGSDKRNLRSNEAALKYFLMGAFATGIMLFGMALMYGATGSFVISDISEIIGTRAWNEQSQLLYAGLLMLLVGLLFKVSAAPFHFWTPDVYDGAPTIFTAYMSTIVKTAGFAALYRLLAGSLASLQDYWFATLATITVLTLLAGNVTAVYQTSFKRMLAYSSISHAGYLLIALTSLTAKSQSSILFYSLAYSLSTVSAFGVLILVSQQQASNNYDAFNGLAKKNPFLAFVLAVSMLSLAGIPLTAGFMGKLFVFTDAAQKGTIWLLVVAILASAIGIYYYFRVLIAAYFKEGDLATIRIAPFYKVVLIIVTTLTIVLGLFPDLVLQLV